MKILVSIESTGIHLGISLYSWDPKVRHGAKISTYYSMVAFRQADLLIPTLNSQLEKTKQNKKDIACVAVDIGPGSFTGVRVGVSAARALGQSLRIPVVGVSSLEAMAFKELKNKKTGSMGVVSLLRALEGESYVAVYVKENSSSALRPLLPPSWMSNKEIEPALKKIKHRSKNINFFRTKEFPHPESVAEVALQKLKTGSGKAAFVYEKAQPLYLQPSWAERNLRR